MWQRVLLTRTVILSQRSLGIASSKGESSIRSINASSLHENRHRESAMLRIASSKGESTGCC